MKTGNDALILWQYPPGFDMPSLSPFCLKIESYLKLNHLDYAVRVTNNPKRGPFGKMPVLVVSGKTVADSRFIIDAINARTGGGLDVHLTKKESATGHALARMIEEHLYFALMYVRWVDPDGFKTCKREFSAAFPFGFRTAALNVLRKMLIRQCRQQGMGRLDRGRIFQLALRDIDAIETMLFAPYLFECGPTSFDCTIHAFLKTIVNFDVNNPMRSRIRDSQKLMDFIREMDKLCWN